VSVTFPVAPSNVEGDFSADLKLVPGKKFTLIGTPEGNEIKDPSRLCSSI
jgi:hypothetical protein